MKSNLDLVNECDSFPYGRDNSSTHFAGLETLYTLTWESNGASTPIGYILDSVLEELVKVPEVHRGEIKIDRGARIISAFQLPTEQERTRLIASVTSYWREQKTFQILDGWRDELYPVYGPENELLYSVERSASTLLGIVTYGIHMTAFVRSPNSSYGMKIWIPRRARGKQTYGGMLDNTVAGGIATGEDPFECLIRESNEEASLHEELIRKRAVAAGTITYIYIREPRAGGESGMIQPECQYVFDLELPPDGIIPKPNDSEVEEFYLWTVEEVQERLAKGEFKPNCALLMLDFFIRHGITTAKTESNYDEIKRRLHRDLEFPGPHKK